MTTLQQKTRALWQRACRYDGIPPDSKFVVFSESNPYVDGYNVAVRALIATRSDDALRAYVAALFDKARAERREERP